MSGVAATRGSSFAVPYAWAYAVYERIQLPVFFVQDLIISCLYVFETFKLRKLRKETAYDGVRRVMDHLIVVNVIVVLLDVTVATGGPVDGVVDDWGIEEVRFCCG